NYLGIRFISLQDQIDTQSPMGKAMFTIIGAMAELESALISERVKAGMAAAKVRGKRFGRPPHACPRRGPCGSLRRHNDHEYSADLSGTGWPYQSVRGRRDCEAGAPSVVGAGAVGKITRIPKIPLLPGALPVADRQA